VNQYREGKVKSTAMSGVKQFLKPDAYKQSEGQLSVIRNQGSEPMAATLLAVGEARAWQRQF
jgi:hypothetical protein